MQFTLTFTGGAADIASVIALLNALEKPTAESKGVTRRIVAAEVEPGAVDDEPEAAFEDSRANFGVTVTPAAPAKRTRGPNKPKLPSDARFAEAAQASAAAPSVVDTPSKPASTLLEPVKPAAKAEKLDGDVVRDRMAEVISKCGTTPVLDSLKEWGARRLQELDAKHYPAFYAKLGDELNKHAVNAVL